MSKKTKQSGQSVGDALRSWFTVGVIILAAIISYLVFTYVMGNPAFFEGGNREGRVLGGNYLAIIYKGGFVVPLLMTVLLVLFTFTIERAITLTRATGKGSINVFVKNLQTQLDNNEIDQAIESCDKQKGSLANVMKAGLLRYKALQSDT